MKRVLYLLICLLLCIRASAKKEVKIILRLNKAEQNDTLGYNLIAQLSQIMYFEIQSNRVKLWDSNKKETEIQASTVADLERTSGIKFTDLDNIFIYETWLPEKKTVKVNTLGILFATKDKRGEDVTFGYVDFNDVKDLLATRYLSVNANGFINIDVAKVLNTKRYTHNIVQYGRKLVKNITLSEKYKNDVFHNRTLESSSDDIVKQKLVKYQVVRNPQKRDPKVEKAQAFLDTLAAYFTRNMELFYNLGGYKLQSYIDDQSVNVTKVEIEELWTQKDGKTIFKTNWLTIFINDKPMQAIAMEDIMDWKLVVYFSNLDRFLKEKLFAYNIIKINDQSIPLDKSDAYASVLRAGRWSQLNQIVK